MRVAVGGDWLLQSCLFGLSPHNHSPLKSRAGHTGKREHTMRLTFIANILALASLASPAVQAQSSYTWAGPTLLSAGLTTNGCNLRIPSATHNGSLGLSNIFVTVSNRGTAAVRITADVELSGNNSRKTGSISGVVQGNSATASMQAMTPGGSTRDGTTLRVRVTSCVPNTP